MSTPRLPTHAEDVWECSFLFESVRDIRAVSCRGGLIVAGGEEIHLVRPGAQNMAYRKPPLGIGPLIAAAAEPCAPWRHAVASKELVAIFFRTKEGDQLMRVRPALPGASPTHIAWGRADGASTLYVRWDDGAIVRMKHDMSGVDATDLPPMAAIAADNAGVLAMVSFALPTPLAYVTRDGDTLEFRPLNGSLEPSQHVHLAVADTAVAFAIEKSGAFVSRSREAPFVPSEPLAMAGPIEFEGASSDAALLGAIHHAGVASIIRVDREGAAVRVADFGSDEVVPPEITSLSWDASRHTLWGASAQMGLVTCTAPSAKGGKKALVS